MVVIISMLSSPGTARQNGSAFSFSLVRTEMAWNKQTESTETTCLHFHNKIITKQLLSIPRDVNDHVQTDLLFV